ncbi:MAG: VOC family protein [Salinirussus sp.]
MSATSRLPAATRIGRVALRVGELDRVREFYETVVGLDTLEQRPDGADLGVDGTVLLRLSERPDLPARNRAETGLFHTAFRFPTRSSLGAALERVDAHAQLTGASDHLVSEALYLDDPEGNGVELYRDRPRSEWSIDDDGRIEMATLPLDLDAIRDDANESPAPPETTIGHVHLEVSDIDASQAFYGDTIGLGVKQTYGDDAIFLAAGQYHHHVGANVWNGRTDPGTGLGLDWFEMLVPNGLDAIREQLSTAGYELTPIDTGIAVEDPDGIELRIRPDTDPVTV